MMMVLWFQIFVEEEEERSSSRLYRKSIGLSESFVVICIIGEQATGIESFMDFLNLPPKSLSEVIPTSCATLVAVGTAGMMPGGTGHSPQKSN
jgi:hypothetical protein